VLARLEARLEAKFIIMLSPKTPQELGLTGGGQGNGGGTCAADACALTVVVVEELGTLKGWGRCKGLIMDAKEGAGMWLRRAVKGVLPTKRDPNNPNHPTRFQFMLDSPSA